MNHKELEEILDFIENPLTQAKKGIELFHRGSHANPELLAKYAEKYVQLMIQGGEQVSSEYSSYDDPTIDILRKLPEEKAKGLAHTYFEKRICDFREQTSVNPVKYLRPLEKFVESFDCSRTSYEFCELANRIIDPSKWSDDIPEDRLEEVIEEVWEIVQNAHSNNSPDAIKKVSNALHHESFQARYSQDGKARELAKEELENDLRADDSIDFEKIRNFSEAYSIDDFASLAKNAVVYQLSQGRIEQSEMIAKEFGHIHTEEDYESARRSIITSLEGLAQAGEIENAIKVKQILKNHNNYREKGLRQEDIPQVVIPEDYHGKIVLMEYRGEIYLRGDQKQSGNGHVRIAYQFANELQTYGFNAHFRWRDHDDKNISDRDLIVHKGGAHLCFNDEEGIKIYDSSVDLGECDKNEARTLVSSLFECREVIVEREQSRRW